MKLFALYFRVALSDKPEWFDDFRKKYDDPYDLHVTVIQPRYIDQSRIDTLKQTVSTFLNTHRLAEKEKVLEFSELAYGPEEDGAYVFMLHAPLSDGLLRFQKELKEAVGGFGEYVEKITEEYEVDFKPHITIGHIPEADLKEVKLYFSAPYAVSGTLTELVLPVVKDTSIAEVTDPKNLTVFVL